MARLLKSCLLFDCPPAGICDADALKLDCQAAGPSSLLVFFNFVAPSLGFGHDHCEPVEHKASEHLGREAVRNDEHFLAETARSIGQRFEGSAPFTSETPHRGRHRPLASHAGHLRSTTK